MNPNILIATIAADWALEAADGVAAQPALGVVCGRCAESDLVPGPSAALWPHATLHRLVAPIEEVLDAEVEDYVAEASDRDQRLYLVDHYRAELRSAARRVVDRALEHGRHLGTIAS